MKSITAVLMTCFALVLSVGCSKSVQGISIKSEVDDFHRTYYWGTIRAGDCVQENAQLTIFPNGTAKFTSVVWSTSTSTALGDFWWEGLDFLDKNQVLLGFGEGLHQGPRMVEGVKYHFDFDFKYNPDYFFLASSVKAFCSC